MGDVLGDGCAATRSRPADQAPAGLAASRVDRARVRKNGFWIFKFWAYGTSIESERRRVRALFEAEGFSVGRRQRGALTGVMFGHFDIMKWRNLRPADRADLHGTLDEDYSPIIARFPANLPDPVDDALLRVSHRDFRDRDGSSAEDAQRMSGEAAPPPPEAIANPNSGDLS